MMIRSAALLLVLHGGLLFAADGATPSAAEWEPVRQALDRNAPTANDQLLGLLKLYPNWVDGNKALARLFLNQGRPLEGLAAARRATALAPDDSEALRFQIRALGELKRASEITALIDNAGGQDPHGWLRYEAGLAAVSLGDSARAEAMLLGARARMGQQGQADLLFLESRIALLSNDLARAEATLSKATAAQPAFWDAWYELGRIRLTLAQSDADQRDAWLAKADDAFQLLVRKVSTDPNAHIGLARTSIERAKALQAIEQTDSAGSHLRTAIGELQQAIRLQPNLPESYVVLGDAHLRLAQWSDAVTALRQAQKLGATDRNLIFNLATALQQSGQASEAQDLLAKLNADSPAEQLTLGMNAYQLKNWPLAISLLSAAADHIDIPETKAAALRFLGHAQSKLAAQKTGDEAELLRDAAAESYQKAGDLKDFPARHFLLAAQSARGADHAYRAAWTVLGWDNLNVQAWSQVVANYGAAKTGGHGMAGMVNRAPLHLAAWSILCLLPLMLFGLNLSRKPPAVEPRPTPPAPRPPAMPTPRRATSGVPGAKFPTPLPIKPSLRKASAQKEIETDEFAPLPNRQKAETVAMFKPEAAATPGLKPQVKPGVRQPSQIIPPQAADQTLQATPSPEKRAQALERRKP